MADDIFLEQQSCMSSTTPTDDEEPKVIQNAHREFALEKSKSALHCGPELISYSIHFSALCFTGVVLQLSFRGAYWADEDNWERNRWSLGLSQPVMAGLLQFAAKLHEIFILVSISTVVIDIIRRRLLMSLGIPFGFLIGAYQFGSASSLFNGSFWGPFTHAIRHRKGKVISLGLLLGVGGIYANAVGPASAVLIVPTLNWWPAYDLTAVMIGDGNFYPDDLRPQSWMPNECVEQEETLPYGCPGLGAIDIRNADSYTLPEDKANRTFIQRSGKSRRNLFTSSAAPQSNISAIYISSTIHSIVMETIGLGGRFVSLFANDDSSIYKIGRPQLQTTDSVSIRSPVVQAECMLANSTRFQNSNADLVFPTNLLSSHNSLSRGPVLPQNYSSFTFNDTMTSNFIWVDRGLLQFEGRMSNASIGAVAALQYFNYDDDDYSGDNLDTDFLTCVLDARWAATEVSYQPSNSDFVLSNISDTSIFGGMTFRKDLRVEYGIGDPIFIHTEWADLLNVPIINNDYSNDSDGRWVPAIQSYLKYFLANPDDDSAHTPDNLHSHFAKFLSLTLADGLSRVGTSDDEELLGVLWDADNVMTTFFLNGERVQNSISPFAIDLSTEAVFNVRRYGWGYGVQTKTAKFAVSILLIHCVIALAYMLFMFIHWSLYTVISRSWKNMDQLFALAMVSSKPPSLKGVSAGVGTWDTWKLDVALREDEEQHEHIELAFGGRDGKPVGRKDDKIKWRKKYN
ncbi:hypothetical protein G7054_g14731 [Neopestalotiopsis clavispora]|nr:hypothetical protein G7054_g14731 [Neopestalotiopsis clavispora]